MKKRNPRAYIGTSGYQYKHWRGPFYPDTVPEDHWFEHYTRHFDSVEINNTFYHLPEVSTFRAWRERAPKDFCYALKFSRYGSHMKCLMEPESTIGKFMDKAKELHMHLGPILVQLRPGWKLNLERLTRFLEAVPDYQRWAFEFREDSWLCAEVFDLMRDYNVALCIHDMLDGHPEEVTADWVYMRFHGDHYGGAYSHQFLTARAKQIDRFIADGLDVYAFFNNDANAYAPLNAIDLKRYIAAPSRR